MYPKPPVKSQKKVTFHNTAFVVLIPTVDEYRQAQLDNQLWWNESDFLEFKISAAKEVKEFMKTVPHLDAKGAMKLYFRLVSQLPEQDCSLPRPAHLSIPIPSNEDDCSPPNENKCPPNEEEFKTEMEVEESSSEDDEFEDCRESEICRIVGQRHDSVTEAKFPRHHNFLGSNEQMNSYLQTVESKPIASAPISSEKSEDQGVSMDSLSVFARIMAVGVLVLMNRNHSLH